MLFPKRGTRQTPFVAPEPCEMLGYLFYFQHTNSYICIHTHVYVYVYVKTDAAKQTYMKTLKLKRKLCADKGYYYSPATYIKSATGKEQ